MGLHTVMGFVLAVLPVYHTLTTLLSPTPQGRPFCMIWGFGDEACELTAR
jgi:hypothetical protein